MLQRQTSGSVVCPTCGRLVGVSEPICPFCGRRNPGLWGFGRYLRNLGGDLAVGQIVVFGCGLLYLVSLLLDPSGVSFGGTLAFLSPSNRSLQTLGMSGVVPVLLEGRWWTLLSAGWLHGGLIHILFNMLWVRSLAPIATVLYGPGRTFILYTLASVVGFALSVGGAVASAYLPILRLIMGGGAGFTVGASAAVFGLLGAIVYASRRGVAAAHIGRQAWGYAVVLFIFGLVLRGIDNWAHLGGFLGGYGVARWLNPLQPERPDHLLGALAALALTIGAVLFSLLRSL